MSDKTPWQVAAERIMGLVATARMRNAPLKEFATDIENTVNAAIAEARQQIEAEARAAAVEDVVNDVRLQLSERQRSAIRAIASAPPGYVCVSIDFLRKLSTYHPTDKICTFGVHGISGFFDDAQEALDAYNASSARPK